MCVCVWSLSDKARALYRRSLAGCRGSSVDTNRDSSFGFGCLGFRVCGVSGFRVSGFIVGFRVSGVGVSGSGV